MRSFACLVLLVLWPLSAGAVQPDEVLDDPVTEARARDISEGLRCLICRNENIDESNADLARDLRLLVRERLLEGDSDQEVVDFVVDRYGEYVLLRPTATGANLFLWIAGPVMLLIAGGIGLVYILRRRKDTEPGAADLSEAERQQLNEILNR